MKILLICSTTLLLLTSTPHLVKALDDIAEGSKGDDSKFTIDEGKLVNKQNNQDAIVETPGPVVSLHEEGEVLYVAMGEHGVAVFDISNPETPTMTKRIPISHGKVTGFIPIQNRLWMQIESRTAVLLEGGFPTNADTEPTTSVIAGPLPESGEVQPKTEKDGNAEEKRDAPFKVKTVRILQIQPGKVKIDAGRDQGIKVGDKYSAYRDSGVSFGKNEVFEGRKLVAVLEVIAVADSTAVALIWKGDRVTKEDILTPANKGQKPSLVYPNRLSEMGEVSLTIRPVLAVGTVGGFGAICDLTAAYWYRKIYFGLRMQPLGFGWTEDGNVVSTSLLGDIGFDTRPFAVGLGAGVAFVNGDIGSMLNSYGATMAGSEDGSNEPKWEQETHHAFALSQHVRMGARDGLNLTVYNTLLYYKGDSETEAGLIYGGTSGKLTWPIAKRTDMFLEGGGGVMGYAFGAIGVFSWIRGNGDAGSLGLSVSAGGAGIWGQRTRIFNEGTSNEYQDSESIGIGGPMISLGLLYRFGFGN